MRGTITIQLPENLERELEMVTVVKAEKTSRSDIVRDAVARYLAVRRFRQLRKKVLPFAEAQGLLTDEDIFKAVSRKKG
ncbi:MAG: CopG family transcriptional regulator [Nitrospirota bacterium]